MVVVVLVVECGVWCSVVVVAVWSVDVCGGVWNVVEVAVVVVVVCCVFKPILAPIQSSFRCPRLCPSRHSWVSRFEGLRVFGIVFGVRRF